MELWQSRRIEQFVHTQLEADPRARPRMLHVLITILLAALTVFVQVKHLGLRYVDSGKQVRLYQRMLEGNAGDPWQYRVLSMGVLRCTLGALQCFGVSHPYGTAFVAFRLVQNIAIFSLAGMLYRSLGLTLKEAFLGLALLAWSMTHALYDSDLQFSTYSDMLAYLVAFLLITRQRVAAYPIVASLGALNRESSGLVPVMLLATCLTSYWPRDRRVKVLVLALVSFSLYAATLVVLRASYASRPLILPYGHHPGWDLLRYNVTRWTTWKHLLVTLNVLPLLSVLSYRSWPVTLKVMVWSIVPAWFVVHFLGAIAAETRLFLVPASTVFVPGALFWFRESGRSQLQTASRMAQSRADHST